MKKLIIAAVMFVFGVSPLALADAVYLKNGKVMQGRIIEKNEQFLVLKMGEDENAVTATIFLEDINRIESAEEYSEKLKLIPEPFYVRDGFKRLSVIQPGTPLYEMPHPDIDEAQRIKDLIEENRRVSVQPGSQSTEPIAYQPAEGSGSISGFVKLPDSVKTKKGDLYVYLMHDIGAGKFSSDARIVYQKIDKDHVNSTLMYYEIKDIAPGTYKVFAIWDIEPPYITVESTESYTNLKGIGLKGDYTGALIEATNLAANEAKANVNFDCLRIISSDQYVPGKGERPDFEIVDIYYRKMSLKDVLFIMVIKNKGNSSIQDLSFNVLLNDQKVFSGPIRLGSIKPKEEREFNITPVYTAYLNKPQEEGLNIRESVRSLKFTVIWSVSGEVEFEKTLFLL